jgi:hypothetical protein
MQFQMEVCGLDECDFLETRFEEYPDAASAFAAPGSARGAILRVSALGEGDVRGGAQYLHSPAMPSVAAAEAWTAKHSEEGVYVVLEEAYWVLSDFSVVLVRRNHAWLEAAMPALRETWDVVVRERAEGGWQARAPKRRAKCLLSTEGMIEVLKIGAEMNEAAGVQAIL